MCQCVTRNPCLQSVNFFFMHPCLSRNPKYTFYTIKSSLTFAYYPVTECIQGCFTIVDNVKPVNEPRMPQHRYVWETSSWVSYKFQINFLDRTFFCQRFFEGIRCSIFLTRRACLVCFVVFLANCVFYLWFSDELVFPNYFIVFQLIHFPCY